MLHLKRSALNTYILHLTGRADCMQPRHLRQSHRAVRVHRLPRRNATGRERRLELWRMLSGLELPGRLLIITTYYSLFTTHYSLLTIHSSPFTTHHSLLTSVLFTTLSIQPTTPLLTVYYSLLASVLFTNHSLQPTTPLLTVYYSLLASGPFYYPLHTTHYLLLTAYYYSYGKAGSSAALPCAAGRFGNATDLQATEQCTLCPLGHSCSTGSSAPTPCSPGTHADRIGLPACQACSSGTYQSATSSRTCLVCVPGYGTCCQARTPE